MALPSRCIHGITGSEDRVIFPIMSLRRAHVTNAAVAVLDVVPINEAAGPLPLGLEIREAMVTNNDDHPRNHAFLHSSHGWRLSPAYDIVPVPLVARERRDLALTVGEFGRVASIFNLLSSCRVFGLSQGDAENIIASMLTIVQDWRTHFEQHGVSQSDIAFIEPAMLPDCFFRKEPVQSV